MKRLSLRIGYKMILAAFVLGALIITQTNVGAALLLDRSVQLSDPKPGATASYTYAFNIQSNANVGSIVFDYCTNSPLFENPCDPPAGLDVSGATLSSEAGETGFAVDAATTTNRLVISRAPSVTAVGPVQYVFGDIINPTTDNQTVYVRISLHSSTDGTGTSSDQGAVVFRVLFGLDTRAYVPPHLTFCAAITVDVQCAFANGFFIDLGELSKTTANVATSQFSTATNDPTGYNVAIFGTTMTSGTNVIPALSSPAASIPGTSQFGINLRNNSSPDVGENPTGPGTATAAADYSIVNNFKFVSGSTLTTSPIVSHFNRFTISYLVNASPAQEPGIYNATFTYVATASF